MDDLISVIVPIYNVEKYLKTCIESILSQTYRTLEIILVNDGSSDASESIMNEYALSDQRICCISQKNGGLSSARNKGLKAAKGEYVLFVDADDFIENNMIETLYHMMDSRVHITACGYYCVDEQGEMMPKHVPFAEEFPEEGIYDENAFWRVYFEKSCIYPVVAWNKMFRRDMISDLVFPPGKYHEDEFFTNRLLEKNIVIKCSPRKLYYYRIRENSITSEVSAKRMIDQMEAFTERIRYFAERKMYAEFRQMFDRMLILLHKLIQIEKKEERKSITEMLHGFQRAAFQALFLPFSVKLKVKVMIFCICGRKYFIVCDIYKILNKDACK